MKAFAYACIAAIVVAIVAALALNYVQKPANEAYLASDSARL